MILDLFRVTGRVAVVTGAGRGIGAATAVALAQAGADVVISARTGEQLAKVAQEVEAAGRSAMVVPADLTDLDAAAGLAAAAIDAFGLVDIVVNNVGGALPRPFTATAPRHLAQAFEFNVAVAHSLTHAAVPHLLAASTENGGGGGAADQHLVRHGEGGGPRVSRVRHRQGSAGPLHPARCGRPGPRGSGSMRSLSELRLPRRSTSYFTDDTLRRRMEQATPLGRIGDPLEVAAAVVFLASPASAYLTGKILEVDSGIDRPNLDLGLPDL